MVLMRTQLVSIMNKRKFICSSETNDLQLHNVATAITKANPRDINVVPLILIRLSAPELFCSWVVSSSSSEDDFSLSALGAFVTTGAAAGAFVTKKSRGSSTLSKRYIASLLSEYTTPVTVALTTPVEMLTLLPYDSTFSGSLVGSLPATVCTGLLSESKLELETYSGRMWNCNSSIFWPSFRELRNPAFSCEKAESSGARMVKPPLLAVWNQNQGSLEIEVMWGLMVLMLVLAAFGEGATFCEAFGAAAGATTATVVEEYKKENMNKTRSGRKRGLASSSRIGNWRLGVNGFDFDALESMLV
ncbi:hypothetical protein SESBI_10708 [Sesbania bispinosa]|nr:hypothetical protein SESBI_10708 [Sesbania bispinosa]